MVTWVMEGIEPEPLWASIYSSGLWDDEGSEHRAEWRDILVKTLGTRQVLLSIFFLRKYQMSQCFLDYSTSFHNNTSSALDIGSWSISASFVPFWDMWAFRYYKLLYLPLQVHMSTNKEADVYTSWMLSLRLYGWTSSSQGLLNAGLLNLFKTLY